MKKATTKKKTAKKTTIPKDKICSRGKDSCKTSCTGPGIYCLGFLGAAIYYIATTTGFWVGVWGVLKALVWPAFLVFKLFTFLGV